MVTNGRHLRYCPVCRVERRTERRREGRQADDGTVAMEEREAFTGRVKREWCDEKRRKENT